MVDIDDRLRSYAERWREEQPAAHVPDVHEGPRHVAVLVTLVAVVGLAIGAAGEPRAGSWNTSPPQALTSISSGPSPNWHPANAWRSTSTTSLISTWPRQPW